MFEEISNSFPGITAGLAGDDYEFFSQLPDDYRRFLATTNGGFVEELRYTFLTGVPFKTETVDNPSRDDWVVEFFGIPTTDAPGEYPADLLQERVDHEAEAFLPTDVIAIARCSQSSLVCISLRDADYGCVFYWDWYWRYPWCKSFFDSRVESVKQLYPDHAAIMDNAGHPLHAQVQDDFNGAILVQLAPSFRAWFEACEDRRDDDDDDDA